MAKQERQQAPKSGTLQRISESYEAARTKAREVNGSLAELASAIKDHLRETRQQQKELQAARATLARLRDVRL